MGKYQNIMAACPELSSLTLFITPDRRIFKINEPAHDKT